MLKIEFQVEFSNYFEIDLTSNRIRAFNSPIMLPTIKAIPLSRPTLLFNSNPSNPSDPSNPWEASCVLVALSLEGEVFSWFTEVSVGSKAELIMFLRPSSDN